jgi:inorganic triphosphatase YgiF
MTVRGKPGRELELKLAIPDGMADSILHRAAMQAASTEPPQQRHELTIYFDTPDLALAGRGGCVTRTAAVCKH